MATAEELENLKQKNKKEILALKNHYSMEAHKRILELIKDKEYALTLNLSP